MKKILLALLVVVYQCAHPIESIYLDIGIKDVGKSAADVTVGLVGKIPDVIPSPDYLFQSSKNLIAGYPFQQVCVSFCQLVLFFFPIFRLPLIKNVFFSFTLMCDRLSQL